MNIYKDKIDGLILTKINYPYLPGKSCGVLKWKPDYLNTIDFLIVENLRYVREYPEIFGDQDNFFVFELYAIHKYRVAFFDFLFVFSSKEYIEIQKQF